MRAKFSMSMKKKDGLTNLQYSWHIEGALVHIKTAAVWIIVLEPQYEFGSATRN